MLCEQCITMKMRKNIYWKKELEEALELIKKDNDFYGLSDSAIIKILIQKQCDLSFNKISRERAIRKQFGCSKEEVIKIVNDKSWIEQ